MDSLTEAVDPTLLLATNRVGTTLRGKWRLDRLLGVGGMASVYAATHRNGSRGAIKILHRELSAAHHVRSRFLKEGYIANKIDHPGAVRVIDDDTAEDGSLFLVMELLDGESLEQRRVRSGGRLDADEVLAVADQLLDVLAAAHAKGIVHRDVKPDNVFLTRNGVVKVLDFGIARLRELSTASQATKTGTMMGTPAFMAPEQARALWDEVDARSDLWSVGATLFHLLTGELVHDGRTANEQLLSAMSSRAAPIASVLPDISPHVAELIDKSLAYEKSERYPDALTMQEAVRRAYHATHGAPISSHRGLTVPETVPNRTLPSADISDISGAAAQSAGTTSAPVSRGRTGVPLASLVTTPRALALAVAAAAVMGVITIVVVAIALHSHQPAAASNAVQPRAAAPTPAAAAPALQAPTAESKPPAVSTRPLQVAAVPLPAKSAKPPHEGAHSHAAAHAESPPPPAAPTATPKPKPTAPALLGNQNW